MLCKDGHSTWEVDGVTLEGFFEQFKIDDCSLLKIDIEGGGPNHARCGRCLKSSAPTFTSLYMPRLWKSHAEEIIKSLDTYPFLYSNQGKLITAEILVTGHQSPALL